MGTQVKSREGMKGVVTTEGVGIGREMKGMGVGLCEGNRYD